MVRMLNALTHTEMFVAEDRVYEYLALGHKVMTWTPLAEIVKETAPPIVHKKEKSPIEEANKKLKETIAKTKKTTRKKA